MKYLFFLALSLTFLPGYFTVAHADSIDRTDDVETCRLYGLGDIPGSRGPGGEITVNTGDNR